MHLKDIFDMTAGTSTGSILAAGLAYPIDDDLHPNSQLPKYFASDLITIYATLGGKIFTKNTRSNIIIFPMIAT